MSSLSGEKLVRKRKRDDGTESWTGNKETMTKSQSGPQLSQKKMTCMQVNHVRIFFSNSGLIAIDLEYTWQISSGKWEEICGRPGRLHTLHTGNVTAFVCRGASPWSWSSRLQQDRPRTFSGYLNLKREINDFDFTNLGLCNPQEIDWSTVDPWDDVRASGFHMHSCDGNSLACLRPTS